MILVLDTKEDARRIQAEIIRAKTPQERALMGVDMIDTTYEMIKRSFSIDNPGINEAELTALVFQRYYKRDFSPAVLQEIMKKIREYKRL